MEKWEQMTSDTYRLKVPGGWLYRVDSLHGVGALGFVPQPRFEVESLSQKELIERYEESLRNLQEEMKKE